MKESLFSPKQVADAMMVSESSVKRWCDRGLIPTIKTAGGHRRITVDSLSQFLSRQSRSICSPEALGLDCRFEDLVRHGDEGQSESEITAPDQLDQDFTRHLLNGDESACRRIMHHLFHETQSVATIADTLVADSMRRIGDAWDCGGADVFQERYGCEICTRLISELMRDIPKPAASAPVAIGCSAEHDSYQLPTKLVESVLRQVGWNAKSMGNNIPWASIDAAVRRYDPQMVWISISVINDRDNFVDDFNHFSSNLPGSVVLIVGGRALDDTLRPLLRYTAYCDNLRQFADLATAMLTRNYRDKLLADRGTARDGKTVQH
ncbi:MAG: helix-turn-helix domain-containing protein [Pirellulaceae bacterium]